MDRIKIFIPREELAEVKPEIISAINKDFNGKKNPSLTPILSYKWKYDGFLIDVCIPKMLFGNSLEEHTDQDLNDFVSGIKQYAYDTYRLDLPIQAIKNAQCWYLEYGKNIILPIRYYLFALLQKIALCLAERSQELSRVTYFSREGNHGCKIGLHTKEYEICWYDKTTKKLYAGTGHDKQVFSHLLKQGKQVLRYEVKFYTHRAAASHLRRCKCIRDFTLQDVWDRQLEHDYLLKTWEKIAASLPNCRLTNAALQKQIYQALMQGKSINDTIFMAGLNQLEGILGQTTLKHLLSPTGLSPAQKKRNKTQYQAFQAKKRKLKTILKPKKEYIVQQISTALEEFKAISLADSEL